MSILAAHNLLLKWGFRRSRASLDEDHATRFAYTRTEGIFAVRVTLNSTVVLGDQAAMLELGIGERGIGWRFRPWSIPMDPDPLKMAHEAIGFIKVIR